MRRKVEKEGREGGEGGRSWTYLLGRESREDRFMWMEGDKEGRKEREEEVKKSR